MRNGTTLRTSPGRPRKSGLRTSVAALAVGIPLLTAVAAGASETLTYSYDARGRLVQVARSGSVNNGVNACYLLDKADNRTNLTVGTGACPTSPPPPPPPAPVFSVSDVSVDEGGNLAFVVSKSGAGAANVNYATANGTATAGSDYTAASGTLSFTSAQTSQNVTVATTHDTTVEPNETVNLNLSGATGGATISDSQGVGTITNNDTANQPPVANPDSSGPWAACLTRDMNVVANDTDPEGNLPLSLVSASTSSSAITVSVISSTTVRIEHYGAGGTFSFNYVVQDSLGATATGTGSITYNSGMCP